MRFVVIIIGAGLALSACGQDNVGTAETGEDRSTYSVDSEDGTVSSTITTGDGATSMESGANVKAKLPENFTIFPGAEVVETTNVTNNEGAVTMVTLRAKADPDQFASFYRNQAERAGIAVNTELTINGNKMLSGKGKNGETFSLNAMQEEGEDTTTAQLSLSKGMLN